MNGLYHKEVLNVKGVDIVKKKTPYEQAREHYTCLHEITEIRYKVYINKIRHYFNQCLTCGGQVGMAIAHNDVPDIDSVGEWDKGLEDGYRFLIDTMVNELRREQEFLWQNRNTEWDRKYETYLQSPQWQDKRRRVLVRDNRVCQACLKREATQVHHKRYPKEFGQEPLFDLVSVCQLCHDALHELRGQGVNRG